MTDGTAATPLLIALASPAMGSGKSEVARRLINRHGFTLLKFAGPLKDMARAFLASLGMDAATVERHVEGDLKETLIPEIGVTCRHVMQTLGTEWGRDCIMPGLWVHLTRARATRLLAAGRSVVIDDMRFLNEMEMVVDLGGTCVRIIRPGIADATGHASEGQLAGAAMAEIVNDGTLADLRDSVDSTLQRLDTLSEDKCNRISA